MTRTPSGAIVEAPAIEPPSGQSLGGWLSSRLDRLVRPELCVFHRRCPSFLVCGYTGLALAIALVMTLAALRELSLGVMSAIVLAGMATFLALAMATKILTGEEILIYYHHEIAILAVSGLLAWLLGQPVLPYLDVTILGIGQFLVCGRVGCLMAGCCHGRPHRWGVRYRPEHAEWGFTPYYVGIRLFPIQIVESLWVAMIVVVGGFLLLSGSPPGTALAWYVIAYDVGRFGFEFVRGDPTRPYYGGFSEAQWISLMLMCVVVWAGLKGVLVFHGWHAAATLGLVLTMAVVMLHQRFGQSRWHRLLRPDHVAELAGIVEIVSTRIVGKSPRFQDVTAHMFTTSLNYQIVYFRDNPGHFSLSASGRALRPEEAAALASLLVRFHTPGHSYRIESRFNGFDVCFDPCEATSPDPA